MHCLSPQSAATFALLLFCGLPAFGNPALEGYANYAALAERVKKLDQSDLAAVASLAKTAGDREIFVITLGTGDPSKKPAIAILDSGDANHLVGSELALRLAERLVREAQQDGVKKLLDQLTIYIIPRPDPDAAEKAFTAPFRSVSGNLRQTDDDRDGRNGEDPPNDLNGDGWITMMRVVDDTGGWMPHPADPRLLIEADAKKNERGKYRLFSEGRDDDGDQQFNEDAGDGVAFNRNWSHRYEPFQPGTGPNAVSEVETRAVADFLHDHTNIFAVFCFSPSDNIFHTWKPDPGKEKQRIRTSVHSVDAPFLDFLADKYRDAHGGKDAPESAWPGGTFAEWSYFPYGRWTLASRAWWVPKVEQKPKEGEEKEGEKKKGADEKRGVDDLNALRWFEQEKLEAFVDWQKVDHPEFPGKTVEVGGFKPFYRTNPPMKLLDDLVGRHVSFLSQLAEFRPRVTISETQVEPLGGRVFRVTAKIASTGYLPTLPEMGEVTGIHQRLQIQLFAPEKTTFLKGSPRVKLPRLVANAQREVSWLVRLHEETADGKLRAWSPELGEVETTIRFE